MKYPNERVAIAVQYTIEDVLNAIHGKACNHESLTDVQLHDITANEAKKVIVYGLLDLADLIKEYHIGMLGYEETIPRKELDKAIKEMLNQRFRDPNSKMRKLESEWIWMQDLASIYGIDE